MSDMHPISAQQLAQAHGLVAELRAEADASHGAAQIWTDYAASQVAAWAGVAKDRGEVRLTLAHITGQLRQRFLTDWKLPVPACLQEAAGA